MAEEQGAAPRDRPARRKRPRARRTNWATLLATERHAREAEERHAARLAALQTVSASLSAAPSQQEVAQVVVDQGVAALGGSAGALYLLNQRQGQLELLASAGYPGDLAAHWREVPLSKALPLTEAVRRQRPVFRSRDELIARFGEHPLLERGELLAAVPIMLHQAPLGALGLSFPPGARVDAEGRRFVATLANYCAQSLERAWLLDAEKAARARSAESEEKLRRILDRVAAMIATADPEADPPGSGTYYNRRWLEYTGLSQEDLLGEGWLQTVHLDDQAEIWARYREGMATGNPQAAVGRSRGADGEYRWHLARGETVLDADGSVRDWIITVIEVDELKRTQQALEEVIREKDAFVGLLSHEVRAPLAAIYGASEILARRGELLDTASRQQLLQDVVEESRRLHRLVENMLVLAHQRAGGTVATEPVLVRHLVTRLAADHRERFLHRQVEVHPGGEGIPVAAEPTYLEQILRNLLTNAEKYSPPSEPIELRLAVENQQLTVSVLDRGPGLGEDDAQHVFEPFYRARRTARNVAGTGIGLAVCKLLVEAQGGDIRWSAREGGGCEFAFSLPIDTFALVSGDPAG